MVGGASPVTAVLNAVTAYVWQYSIRFVLVMPVSYTHLTLPTTRRV